MRLPLILPALLFASLLAPRAEAQILRPNLRILNLSLSTTTFREGSQVTMTLDVDNNGTWASDPCTLGVYLSNDANITRTDVLLRRINVPGLGITGVYQPNITFTVPTVTQSTRWAGAFVDDGEVITEYNEDDNTAALQVACIPLKPDLEVTALDADPINVSVGTPVRLTATVRNIGERSSPATTATFYLSQTHMANQPTGSPLGTVPVPVLAVNGSAPLILDVTIASVPHGGDAFWVIRVAPTSVPELNTANNDRIQFVRCSVTPGLDWNQTPQGPAASRFGHSVGAAGDVDGDGADDLIVGLPLDDTVAADAGSAWVLSGRTGARLWTFPGPSFNAQQGLSVAGAGDVDGDGVPDLIVGAPFTSGGQLSRSGRATLYSGRTGGVIRLYEGEESGANLGLAVAGVGDVDGDGYDDVAITVPGDSGRGSVRVHSGRTGGRMFLFFGSSGSYLGQSVAAAGDVNRDGFADVIVGAPVEDAAYVLSGRTGQLLRRLQGTDAFGASVCGVGDVNADGFPDLAVGSPNGGPGRVELFSGQTFGLLRRVYEWQPGEGFGSSLAGGGDVNGDGVPDVAVGMPAADPWGTNSGRTAILSGLDGTTLFSFMGSGSGMELGCSVALIRDVNDDGRADLLMGTRGTDAAQLFLTSGKTIGRSNLFGRPGATSGGLLPRAGVGGSPQIGTTVSLALRAAPPASLALMLLGFLRADVDLGPSGAPGNRLYTFPTLILTTGTGIDGRAALPIALPDEPGLVGVGCFLQWGVIDPPANALGVVSSDAARIVIGRL